MKIITFRSKYCNLLFPDYYFYTCIKLKHRISLYKFSMHPRSIHYAIYYTIFHQMKILNELRWNIRNAASLVKQALTAHYETSRKPLLTVNRWVLIITEKILI